MDWPAPEGIVAAPRLRVKCHRRHQRFQVVTVTVAVAGGLRDRSRCALLERECAGARNTYCVCDHRSLRGATPSRRALYLQEVCIAPPLLVVIHPLSHTDAKHPRPFLPERVVNSSLSAVLNDKVH